MTPPTDPRSHDQIWREIRLIEQALTECPESGASLYRASLARRLDQLRQEAGRAQAQAANVAYSAAAHALLDPTRENWTACIKAKHDLVRLGQRRIS